MALHLVAPAVALLAGTAPAPAPQADQRPRPDSLEVRLEGGPPASEPSGQYLVFTRIVRGGREIQVDTLNSACLDTTDTPPPVRDTTALRARLPELVRWHRFRALPDSMGSAMFLYLGLRRLAGPGALVLREEAEALRDRLERDDPVVLEVRCWPLHRFYVWQEDRQRLLTWFAMRLGG
jgi:hypothetical protein